VARPLQQDWLAVRKQTRLLCVSLCLSRACLGKIIIFIYKWLLKKTVLLPSRHCHCIFTSQKHNDPFAKTGSGHTRANTGEKKRRFPFRFEFTSGYIGLVRVGPSSAVRTETCCRFYCAISLLRDGKATIFCQDRLGTSMWKCQDRLGTNDVTTLPAGGDLRPDASGPGSAAGAARTAGAARASRRMQGEDSYPPHSRLLQLQRLVRKCGVFWLIFYM
jgi:hypothetical protein